MPDMTASMTINFCLKDIWCNMLFLCIYGWFIRMHCLAHCFKLLAKRAHYATNTVFGAEAQHFALWPGTNNKQLITRMNSHLVTGLNWNNNLSFGAHRHGTVKIN